MILIIMIIILIAITVMIDNNTGDINGKGNQVRNNTSELIRTIISRETQCPSFVSCFNLFPKSLIFHTCI